MDISRHQLFKPWKQEMKVVSTIRRQKSGNERNSSGKYFIWKHRIKAKTLLNREEINKRTRKRDLSIVLCAVQLHWARNAFRNIYVSISSYQTIPGVFVSTIPPRLQQLCCAQSLIKICMKTGIRGCIKEKKYQSDDSASTECFLSSSASKRSMNATPQFLQIL